MIQQLPNLLFRPVDRGPLLALLQIIDLFVGEVNFFSFVVKFLTLEDKIMVLKNIFQSGEDEDGTLDVSVEDQVEVPSDVGETANREGDHPLVEAMDIDEQQNHTGDGQIQMMCKAPDNRAKMDTLKLNFPKPRSCPSLTQEIVDEVDKQFAENDNDEMLNRYAGANWLDDTTIDAYLELIKVRNQANENYPKIYRFDCFFYSMLKSKHFKDGGYETVRETARGDDIFSYDLVFFPCEISRHWRMVVLDIPAKTLLLYDSLNCEGENIKCLKNIAMYLKREYERVLLEKSSASIPSGESENPDQTAQKKKLEKCSINKQVKDFFDSNRWTVKIVDPMDIPRQGNSNDCGIFLLQYAEYLSRRMTFDFTQVHGLYFRYKMAHETMNGKLMID